MLQIRHAWGGQTKAGVYADIAQSCEMPTRDLVYAKSVYGGQGQFDGICQELLAALEGRDVTPAYDAVLIDEAQDLPLSFFKLVHRFTKEPKRIVLAYDELQNLTNAAPAVADLFDIAPDGQTSFNFGHRFEDIVLPVCYRNTPWALTLAHALGFGIYRKEGLVQLFDNPALWGDIGYEPVTGKLKPGSKVLLKRREGSYPEYFDSLQPDDAIKCLAVKDELEQAKQIAADVAQNIRHDQLEEDDILIILPDAMRAVSQAKPIIEALVKEGISAHLVGVTTSQDGIFVAKSVAITNIYRAKGNEAPMVYVANSQFCFGGAGLMKLRNTLFTAITRSRAWVRLYGWGDEMPKLIGEIDGTRKRDYGLEFRIPSRAELTKIHRVNRERTPDEQAKLEGWERALQEFADALQSGDVAPENLDAELMRRLREYLATKPK